MNPNISRALNSLPLESRRVIEGEFKRLSDELLRLENKKVVLTDDLLKQIRDVAKREAQYFGASAVGTWKIKDTIRIESDEIKRTTDVRIFRGGELVIRGELRLG